MSERLQPVSRLVERSLAVACIDLSLESASTTACDQAPDWRGERRDGNAISGQFWIRGAAASCRGGNLSLMQAGIALAQPAPDERMLGLGVTVEMSGMMRAHPPSRRPVALAANGCADAARSTRRERLQGFRRIADLLRGTGSMGRRRQPRGRARGRDPKPRERRGRGGRSQRRLHAQNKRLVAPLSGWQTDMASLPHGNSEGGRP